MNKRTVFVFDTTRGFSRFLRTRYSNLFDFDICNNPERFQEIFEVAYDISFVTINKYEDLLNFSYVYENSKYIFVGSAHEDVLELLPKLKKVILLDLRIMKSEVVKLIDVNLNAIKFDLDEKIKLNKT